MADDGAATLPLPAVSQLNSRLLRYFVKRYALRRGAIVFGKLLPVGIGAVVGGVGNRLMGKQIIDNARMAFGSPPPRWPAKLHVLPLAARLKTSLGRSSALVCVRACAKALAFRRRKCG